ncbi:hypothetical protein HMPREF9318_01744 [Streptococcus urinalis FB127-CNA-2]|nr:hypothetical protein [Streptococcus urinalis]EKS18245.1 hypothetical protein HMPREF9318_01744 [Streptococcus urinalis FB127-CNA-2]VEF32881.1 Uncharacterised protein [Streptococcus urinalis]
MISNPKSNKKLCFASPVFGRLALKIAFLVSFDLGLGVSFLGFLLGLLGVFGFFGVLSFGISGVDGVSSFGFSGVVGV